MDGQVGSGRAEQEGEGHERQCTLCGRQPWRLHEEGQAYKMLACNRDTLRSVDVGSRVEVDEEPATQPSLRPGTQHDIVFADIVVQYASLCE